MPCRFTVQLGSARLRRFAPRVVLFALAMLFAVLPPASADWLLYQDGTRLETAGEWKIEGKLVVFSLPNGTLSAVKLDELDLDASRELTRVRRAASSKRPQAALEDVSPRRKTRIVITDADVAHVDPDQFEASPDAESEPVAPERGLVVTRWGRSEPDADGILIVGNLHNESGQASAGVSITVRALGQNDEILIEQPAILDATVLMPGQNSRFEARLNRVFSFRELKFEISSIELEVAGPETAPQS